MAQNNGNHSVHFVVPYSMLKRVGIILLVMTVLTVVTAKFVHLGALGPLVAFAIAGYKAYLVMAHFMGLKYDVVGNRIIFSLGFAFLALLLFFCALDIYTRHIQGSVL